MKKGQMNQVFVIIMAMIIVGAIVLISIKMLSGTLNQKCDVDFITFGQDIKDIIASNNDFGTVNEARLGKPCDYAVLCMIDSSAIKNKEINDKFKNEASFEFGEFFIKNSVENQVETNVFLVKNGDEVKEAGYIEQLVLENPTNATCIIAKGGSFSLLLKGQGRTTLVAEK